MIHEAKEPPCAHGPCKPPGPLGHRHSQPLVHRVTVVQHLAAAEVLQNPSLCHCWWMAGRSLTKKKKHCRGPPVPAQQLEGDQWVLEGNQRLLEGNRRLSEGNRQQLEGNRRLSEGNRQRLEGNRRLSEGNRQQLEGNRRLSEGNRQRLEGNRRLSEGNRQQLEGNRRLSEGNRQRLAVRNKIQKTVGNCPEWWLSTGCPLAVHWLPNGCARLT